MPKCSNCDHDVAGDAVFCPRCGKRDPSEFVRPDAPPPEKWDEKATIHTIIGAAALGLGWLMFSQSGRFSFAWCLGVALLIVGAALVKRAATIVVGLGLAIACILVTAFIAICTIIMLVKYFWMYPH